MRDEDAVVEVVCDAEDDGGGEEAEDCEHEPMLCHLSLLLVGRLKE